MIKRLTMVALLIVSFSITASAQFGFPPHVPTALRLTDDELLGARFIIIREDGSYLISIVTGIGTIPLRLEGQGTLKRRGCALTLTHNTPEYRLKVQGDTCQGTGFALLNYFPLGSYAISDRTEN